MNTRKRSVRDLLRRGCIVAVIILSGLPAAAQVQNNSSLYIGSSGIFHVSSGTYYFGSAPATTVTDKSANRGALSFDAAANWQNAGENHFVDGYVKYTGNARFVFPVGASGTYAPAALTPSAAATADVAYFAANPATIGSALNANLTNLSQEGYWDIKTASANAAVTLTWRAATNVASITGSDLGTLTIVGWNGTEWAEIASAVDATSLYGAASSLQQGSITATGVNVSAFTAFSLASKQESCAPLTPSSGITKTWNGSWSPSAPTLSDPVVINAPFTGTLQCNSLVLNADITLTGQQYVEIVNGVSGAGKINMASEASVVQRNAAAGAPDVVLAKTTGLKRRYDYIYWGTPIAGNFFAQINNAKGVGAALANVFDLKHSYLSGAGGGWQTLSATNTGRGFITRIKNQAPFADAVTLNNVEFSFTGTANNGDVSVSVVNNPAAPNGGTSYNLLANPYPSALDAAKFLEANPDLDGAIYLWTSSTESTGLYSQADYAIWNLAGAVGTSPTSQLPTGKIASGQGFKVKALGAGTATFTNCMRVTEGNNNFFRMSNAGIAQADRFKLTMKGENGVYSQIQIGYFPEATLGYDRLLDAGRNSVSTSQIYSFIGEQKIAINSRPAFDMNDVVNIGVSKGTADNGNFVINVQDKEGIFANSDIKIYLYDTLEGLYYDLTNADRAINVTDAQTNNRFQLVYKSAALGNDQFAVNVAVAALKNERLTVKANEPLEGIEVFDIAGRHITSINCNGNTEINEPFNHQDGIYIVRIKATSGAGTSAKLINVKNK